MSEMLSALNEPSELSDEATAVLSDYWLCPSSSFGPASVLMVVLHPSFQPIHMKLALCLSICVAMVMRANPVALQPLRATLVGETVSVMLLKGSANVTAIYEFSPGANSRPKQIFFPVFADAPDDPAKVLLRSGLDFEVDGQSLGLAVPCAAPIEVLDLPPNVQIFWFTAEVETLVSTSDAPGQFRLKAHYVQPLINGRFFYIPLISGYDTVHKNDRPWRYQLHAYTSSRMPQVTSTSDYEPMGNAVTVYLKNGELVQLQ